MQQAGEAGFEIGFAQAVEVRLALFFGGDQAGFAQDFEVVVERAARGETADIAAAETLALGQFAHDGEAHGIAQRVQHLRQVELVGFGVGEAAHRFQIAGGVWIFKGIVGFCGFVYADCKSYGFGRNVL